MISLAGRRLRILWGKSQAMQAPPIRKDVVDLPPVPGLPECKETKITSHAMLTQWCTCTCTCYLSLQLFLHHSLIHSISVVMLVRLHPAPLPLVHQGVPLHPLPLVEIILPLHRLLHSPQDRPMAFLLPLHLLVCTDSLMLNIQCHVS